MTMNITVIGTDYEGLTISVGLATLGHKVTAVDINKSRARRLQRGMAVDGNGDGHAELSDQMKLVLREGLLKITSEPENCLTEADAVIIAGIPGCDPDSIPERTAILRTAECLTGAIASFSTVLVTAEVPTGSCRMLQDWLDDALPTGSAHVVCYPVFFEEPHGLRDFLNPDRIVLGYENERSRRTVDELFAKMLQSDPAVCHVSWEAAEMMRSSTAPIAAAIPGSTEIQVETAVESLERAYSRAGHL